MPSLHWIIEQFKQEWWIYVTLPLVAAAIGYVTKIIAIRMMFQPTEHIGFKYFGWQGIVPRKAARMASTAVDLITTELLDIKEVFGRLDPERVAREMEGPMLDMVDDIAREIMSARQPGLWETLPEAIKKRLIQRLQKEAPQRIAEIMADVRDNLQEVFDLKEMVVSKLVRDKKMMSRMFRNIGREEFKFIARSGIYFGLAIGLFQAVLWGLTHEPLIMPVFGAFIGWFSDWMAIKMVFEPRLPRRVMGIFPWQGLFIKRRKQVASEYAHQIAKDLVTPHNMIEEILGGPRSSRLFELVAKHVQRAVDEFTGVVKPLVVLSVGSEEYIKMKREVAAKVMERAPIALKEIEAYAAQCMQIERTLEEKMHQLDEEQFESLLRPVFKEDEWILITVGAVLGFLVGELQVFIILGGH